MVVRDLCRDASLFPFFPFRRQVFAMILELLPQAFILLLLPLNVNAHSFVRCKELPRETPGASVAPRPVAPRMPVIEPVIKIERARKILIETVHRYFFQHRKRTRARTCTFTSTCTCTYTRTYTSTCT